MYKNPAIIIAEFEINASRLFDYLYGLFKNAAEQLDRGKDENVFQQLTSQYTYSFKEQLVQMALGFIEEYKQVVENVSQIQQALTKRIELYVNEFNQKAGQL